MSIKWLKNTRFNGRIKEGGNNHVTNRNREIVGRCVAKAMKKYSTDVRRQVFEYIVAKLRRVQYAGEIDSWFVGQFASGVLYEMASDPEFDSLFCDTSITIKINSDLFETIIVKAERQGMTVDAFVSMCITKAMFGEKK